MEYIIMLAFVGWLTALIWSVPAAPSYNEESVSLDLSFADAEEDVIEFRKAA
ncbi:MAG: hypothetical protein OEZ28_14740 [Nitrospinota bacterium]|nr:hypothetical protein [Nitrospinota bacterium]